MKRNKVLNTLCTLSIYTVFFIVCGPVPKPQFDERRKENPNWREDVPAKESFDEVTFSEIPPDDAEVIEKFKSEIQRFWLAPYVWGGASPSGTDCSGLVHSLYKRAIGMDIPRGTKELYEKGKSLYYKDLRFADLIFFNNNGSRTPSHVGLYVTKGFFLHASVSKGVILSKLTVKPYRDNYIGARRYLK